LLVLLLSFLPTTGSYDQSVVSFGHCKNDLSSS
jgi:hypothetical protein